MIKAIIVDDEEHCISRLNSLFTAYCPNVDIVAECSDIEDAFEKINSLRPDAVFLDVQIHDTTGFDLLQKYSTINFDVVFTTAYEKYAIQAFRFSAADYLLKPIDPDDLKAAVKKLENNTAKNNALGNFNILAQNVKNFQQQNKKISIPTLNGFEIINIQDIIRCNSDVNYTTIHLKNKKGIMVAKTLKEFELLLAPYNFFRVHNSHLVNLDCIKSYNKGKGGYLKLEDNTEIEVSTRRRDDFLKRLTEL